MKKNEKEFFPQIKTRVPHLPPKQIIARVVSTVVTVLHKSSDASKPTNASVESVENEGFSLTHHLSPPGDEIAAPPPPPRR